MGTSRSPAEAARKFAHLAARGDEIAALAVRDAAQDVKSEITRRAPSRLSGAGKNGARIGVRYDYDRTEDGAKARVYAFGPFHLIERDTDPHRIPRVAKTARARKRKRLAIPGIGVRAWANHPGTKGKHPFQHGVDAAMPGVSELLQSRTLQTLRQIF